MTHVQAAQDFLIYPFLHGCQTINVFHVIFDGALFQPLSSALYSHHNKALVEQVMATGGIHGPFLQYLSWFIATPCMSHSCHNALKWALKDMLENRARMKDIWACVASLRSSFGGFQPFITMWTAARLCYAEDDDASAWPYS
eukprot:5048804-Alexandrium_andersonii.AAC.1